MKSIPVITGATAVGKTDVALLILDMKEADYILSADSRKVYRGLTVGTSSPSLEEIKKYPYELISVRDPDSFFSASEFSKTAERILLEKKEKPLVEGGSVLYIKALFEGLFEAPPADIELRDVLKKRLQEEGCSKLWEELRVKDPESAGSIHRNDSVRVIRALEVLYQTGKSMRTLWRERPTENQFRAYYVGIRMSPARIKEKIRKRTFQMLKSGMPEEAYFLKTKFGSSVWPFSSIGYKEALDLFEGRLNFDEALERISVLTWQYARKQTVFLKKLKDIFWIDCDNITPNEAAQAAVHYWKTNGL
ncbi:tRNA (adenosine(37)-N6)-dimethylallyltransferase MiaA [candidate division WOR-3 bacterium]|nr:tRNA (adenosine(37)-N6)-dimethylallyltransferase MiaA [candidate division WOR-3 bacterium]